MHFLDKIQFNILNKMSPKFVSRCLIINTFSIVHWYGYTGCVYNAGSGDDLKSYSWRATIWTSNDQLHSRIVTSLKSGLFRNLHVEIHFRWQWFSNLASVWLTTQPSANQKPYFKIRVNLLEFNIVIQIPGLNVLETINNHYMIWFSTKEFHISAELYQCRLNVDCTEPGLSDKLWFNLPHRPQQSYRHPHWAIQLPQTTISNAFSIFENI